MTLYPGQTLLGRYQIKGLLGEGGMGAVYQAFDTFDDKSCAVKEFRLGHLPSEQDTQLRSSQDATHDRSVKTPHTTREAAAGKFEQEAKLLSRLDHPHLPKVTNYFQMDNNYYLVMTLITGQDLAKRLEEVGGPLPEQQVLGWMMQVMDALEYIHGQDPPIIHRDIKPANIVVDANEQAYLVDFGIAKPFAADSRRSAVPITTGFSPIEQYGNSGRTDVRSDIYSLGASLYTLLTGNEPTSAIDRVSGEELVSPRQKAPEISLAVDASIVRALSISPDDRFGSMAEMRAAMQTSGSVTTYLPRPPMLHNRDTVKPVQTPRRNRARFPLVTCAVVVLIVLCITTATLLGNATNGPGLVPTTRTTWAPTATKNEGSVPTPTPTIVIPYEEDRAVLLGPIDMALAHQPDNNSVEIYETGLNLGDFVVQARFYNPYDASNYDWDYGFGFRMNESGGYRVYVDSSGTWYLTDVSSVSGSMQFTDLMSGTLSNLITAAGCSNLLRLEIARHSGWFRVNNRPVAQLDLSRHPAPGTLWLGTGLASRHEFEGETTRFDELVAWAPVTHAQMTATSEALSTAMPRAYSLAEGRLEHTDPQTTQRVATKLAGVQLRNLVAQARFFNPYDTSAGAWDYGFGFRVRGANTEYRFYVDSDSNWEIQRVVNVAGHASATTVAKGQLTNLDVTPSGANFLRLVVADQQAEVYVNNTYVAAADVAEGNIAGDVWIGTGMVEGHMVAGKATRFEEFVVLALPDEKAIMETATDAAATATSTPTALPRIVLAPRSGVLTHKLDSLVATYSPNVSMRDFTLQVRFFNPYDVTEGSWDYGVAFRAIAADSSYRLVVQSNRTWYFGRITPSQDGVEFSVIAQGQVPNLEVAPSGANLLRVEVNGDQGKFFLNDTFVASLNTSNLDQKGIIYIGTGFFEGNEIAGKSTRFEEFAIWAPAGVTEATATARATDAP